MTDGGYGLFQWTPNDPPLTKAILSPGEFLVPKQVAKNYAAMLNAVAVPPPKGVDAAYVHVGLAEMGLQKATISRWDEKFTVLIGLRGEFCGRALMCKEAIDKAALVMAKDPTMPEAQTIRHLVAAMARLMVQMDPALIAHPYYEALSHGKMP